MRYRIIFEETTLKLYEAEAESKEDAIADFWEGHLEPIASDSTDFQLDVEEAPDD
jgi:hypothetical protein